MKKLMNIAIGLMFIMAIIISTTVWAGDGGLKNKTPQLVDSTDQFTPYQNGDPTDLQDNENIPDEVKDRIYDLSDVQTQSKTGALTKKVANPSIPDRQK